MIIAERDRQDFVQEVSERGLDPDDFVVTEFEDGPVRPGFQASYGRVVVRRTSTGAERTYVAAYGSAWVTVFCADLAKRRFD